MRTWDAIDWDSLHHNYGSAGDIPGLLEQCASGDREVASEAVTDLDAALYHQGGWIGSAAAAALPFLLDLALDPATHFRTTLVDIAWSLGRTSHEVGALAVDEAWPSAARVAGPKVQALLGDHDPQMRRLAIQVAACLVEPATAEGLLINLLHSEEDQATRIDLVDALAVALKRDPTLTQTETAAGWPCGRRRLATSDRDAARASWCKGPSGTARGGGRHSSLRR